MSNNLINNINNNINKIVNNVNTNINNLANNINNIANNKGISGTYSNLHVVVIFVSVLIVVWVLVYTYNRFKAQKKKAKEDAKIKPAICPDYWESLGDNRCKNVHKIGKCNLGDVGSDITDFNSEIYTHKKIGNISKCEWSKKCESPWEEISNLC